MLFTFVPNRSNRYWRDKLSKCIGLHLHPSWSKYFCWSLILCLHSHRSNAYSSMDSNWWILVKLLSESPIARAYYRALFTFSSHTEYVKWESIVIAWMKKKKKFSLFDKCLWFLCLRRQNKPKKMSVCLDVRTYVDFSCGHNNFWRS